jgi:hypothetical protein
VGDLWVATPESVPQAQRSYLSWLTQRIPEPAGALLDGIARQLPPSCLILTVAEPARTGGRSGATVTIGLDLDPLS